MLYVLTIAFLISATASSKGITLASYCPNYQRALEVLDEIQNLLIPKTIINTFDIEKKDLLDNNQYLIFENKVKDFSIEQFKTYVYKMPKE